jgi:endonuclease-8
MPEGPEIRLAADEVASALVARPTTAVEFAFPHLRRFSGRLRGQRVTDVATRGKAILTHFDNGLVIYSHNQLYGRWFIEKAGHYPDTGRQLRLAIHNSEYSALLYSASEIDVLKASELQKHPFLARLGPDLLNDNPDAETIFQRLTSPRFRQRQLAGLLLDQGFVAGLGNYLRAEILTRARLHPALKPSQCNDLQLRCLAGHIIGLTRRAYRTRGIINPPKLVSRLKQEGLVTREQHRFNSYGRAGQACHFCGGTIEVSNAGGRKMYFCPGCQPATPAGENRGCY